MQIIYPANSRLETIPMRGGGAVVRIADDVTGEPLFAVTAFANAVKMTRASLLLSRVPEINRVYAMLDGMSTPTVMTDGRSLRSALRSTRSKHRQPAEEVLQWLYTCYPEPDDPAANYGTYLMADLRQKDPHQKITASIRDYTVLELLLLLQQHAIPTDNERIWLPFVVTPDFELTLQLPSSGTPPAAHVPETPFHLDKPAAANDLSPAGDTP